MKKATKKTTRRKRSLGYADGFVIPLPKKNIEAYRCMAEKGAEVWKEHGALEYRECISEDLSIPMGGLPFTKLAKLKPGEIVVFSWIVYKSRAHRDKVNAKVMKDPRMNEGMQDMEMPFDMKRMTYGGFEILVEA